MYCSHCGNNLDEKARFCPGCGKPVAARAAAPSTPGLTDSQKQDAGVVATYYPVSSQKFIILSVLTFGLYQVYWFYQNWVFLRERDQSNISPLGRAILGVFFYDSLIRHLSPEGQDAQRVVPIAAPIAYFVLTVAGWLPDPIWLLILLSFLPLLPAVKFINARNASNPHALRRNSAWKLRHALPALITVPVLVFVVASSVGLIESYRESRRAN